jgi:hypothetical protein
MKRILRFLTSVEESFLFRFGKRTWQILSVLAILSFVYALVFYLYNTIPTSREEVKISKMEYDKNEIDADFDESNNIDACTNVEYKNALEELRKMMPGSEWINLGDSVTKTDYTYEEREIYDYYWDQYYTDYVRVPYTYKDFNRNENAIPNILDDIYNAKAIDSASFCEKIKVVNFVKEFISYANKKEATRLLKYQFKTYLEYNNRLRTDQLADISGLFQSIYGHKPLFKDPNDEKDDWHSFSAFLGICRSDSLTKDNFEVAQSGVQGLVAKGVKDKEVKFFISRMILSSGLKLDDISKANQEFFDSPVYKLTDKNAVEIYNKYLSLFSQKVALAEERMEEKEFQRAVDKENYLAFGTISFVSILSIASILILYSIRNILREKE